MYKDLIINRKSVRTFDTNKKIDSKTLNLIKDEISKLNNPFNQDFTIYLFDALEYGLDTNVSTGEQFFIIGKIKKTKHHELAIGYMLEKLTVFLEKLGINSVYMAATFDRNKFEKIINLESDEVMPLIMPLGYKALELNKKDRALRRVLHSDLRNDISSFVKNIDYSNTELVDILNTIKWSPSATNKQPIRIIIEADCIDFYIKHYKPYSNGTTDIQRVDLGIMIANLELALMDYNKKIEILFLNKNDIDENTSYELSIKILK